jgi:Subtilase family
MRIIIFLLFCLVLVSCASTVPQDVVETESIVDPRDALPWNKPGYFGSLEQGRDYEIGELIAIYRQIVPSDNTIGELNFALARYLRDRGLASSALRLVDLSGDGVGDAVYPIAATVPTVTVGSSPVCGQLIARITFDGSVLSLEQAISALLDLNTSGFLPQGNSLYGISPKGKGRLTSSGTSVTPAFRSSHWSYAVVNGIPVNPATGIKVAVLDTGVNPVGTLILRNRANFIDLVPNSNQPTTNTDDDFDDGTTQGHGTAIASLIADDTYGIAPGARIVPVKVCNNTGVCDDIAVTRGICYAQSKGADVINLSLGTLTNSPMVRQAIREVTTRGSLVVAAAGNTNIFTGILKNKPDYPAYWAGLKGLMSVGAIDQNLEYGDFATANRFVELVAPGADRLLELGNPPVDATGIESYDAAGHSVFFEGTSFAAPFVAGAAANLYAQCSILRRNNSFGPRWIEDVLKGTATSWTPVSQDPIRNLPGDFLPAGIVNIGDSLSVPCP